jgi:xanthine dehydrogenase YagS FAD-binding subunit
MCVALAALDATINLTGPVRERTVPFQDFHRLPGATPNVDTDLQPGELITSIDLPAVPAGMRSTYRKVRDRASYAFALVSVAATLVMDGGRIQDVRLALGGVAPKPWRARTAERLLAGVVPAADAFATAAEAELATAQPRTHNRFKIELARRTIVATLMELSDEGNRR